MYTSIKQWIRWRLRGWSERAYRQWFGLRPAKMNYSTLDDCGGGGAVRVAMEHLKRRKRDNNLNSSRFQTTSKVLQEQ